MQHSTSLHRYRSYLRCRFFKLFCIMQNPTSLHRYRPNCRLSLLHIFSRIATFENSSPSLIGLSLPDPSHRFARNGIEPLFIATDRTFPARSLIPFRKFAHFTDLHRHRSNFPFPTLHTVSHVGVFESLSIELPLCAASRCFALSGIRQFCIVIERTFTSRSATSFATFTSSALLLIEYVYAASNRFPDGKHSRASA